MQASKNFLNFSYAATFLTKLYFIIKADVHIQMERGSKDEIVFFTQKT